MAEFIIAYHGGGAPESPEAAAEQRDKWQAWLEGLGDAVVNAGTPLKGSRMITSLGVGADGGPNPLTGFSIVKAGSMDEALNMAKICPFLSMGTIEVAEILEM